MSICLFCYHLSFFATDTNTSSLQKIAVPHLQLVGCREPTHPHSQCYCLRWYADISWDDRYTAINRCIHNVQYGWNRLSFKTFSLLCLHVGLIMDEVNQGSSISPWFQLVIPDTKCPKWAWPQALYLNTRLIPFSKPCSNLFITRPVIFVCVKFLYGERRKTKGM